MQRKRPAIWPLINATLALVIIATFAFGRRPVPPLERWGFIIMLGVAAVFSIWRAFAQPGPKR